ncbi:hypothetical protein CBR_g37526 [Chara braunii]|uniref:Oligosaccharyltransferase complex subunit n=1 Tax=Chara braunii TaxID=69332 RepID=A0A388LNB1_CHABU|nr:hypothetical protein CBR_g37526 [Chara braunii]|eukprot:GBG83725.1 hypothetical protein CBR_g37526 [Chara braunii]
MDPVFPIISRVPYAALRPPKLKLRIPQISLPSAGAVYGLVLISYFLVVSGIVYDIIQEPPGIGSRQDPITGAVKPVVFLPHRVNGQYIIEGLASGFMFVLGGLSIILLDWSCDKTRAKNVRLSFILSGASFLVISYAMSMLFLRYKIPGYLR